MLEGIKNIDDLDPWPHQAYGVDAVIRSMVEGTRRILVQSPTGGGKTWMMAKVIHAALAEGWGAVLFANRKILIEQMRDFLSTHGIDHGVRSAGTGRNNKPFQVASIQTEHSRVNKRKVWDIHDAGLIVVDEAHINENPSSLAVYEQYVGAGAYKVGFTATPIGLDGCYDTLIQAGLNSELRACGALVPAVHYGCTEPDLRNIGRIKVGEDLSDPQNIKAIMVPGIHGRVIEHFRRLNPHGLPSIGFAPGVPESVGFAQAFEADGIPAAHIDGDRIWIRGHEIPSTEESRRELLRMSRAGEVRIIWNRFVLREAVDMPWLRHGILATVFGSLQSYLQSGGRLLRACAQVGKRDVSVQDHGGNWHRHGSLNADRIWRLFDTNNLLANERLDRLTGDGNDGEPPEPEPMLCPRCFAAVTVPRALTAGSRCRCPNCGFEFDFSRRSRPVIQADGALVLHTGRIYNPKRVERRPDTAAKWRAMYFRAKNSKNNMTFNQAAGLFYADHGYFPPRNLPLMPVIPLDWHLPVKSVKWGNLRQEEK